MTKIDNRIAKMEFDNKDFERGISQSARSLRGFDKELSQTGRSSNLNGLGDMVTGVSDKFSVLQTIGVGALLKIGSQAVVAGQRMLSALMIEPITQGYQEYELKIDSIKTILASAKTDEGLPVTLAIVNEKLGELNEYSDQTIYNFADMTSNIGKFTNSGVGLDTSVLAIKGIANAAALAGANSNEASRAMYNFSQALSAGYVKLIDWKSIENANMATVDFKTQLLESAVAAGTLTKTVDGMYQIVGSETLPIDATKGFNDSLQEQWMTTDALTMTLKNYADTNTEIGKKATEAATKVRTFSQLMDTTKEAVGSGWAQTFELLIGDFEEATRVFTGLSDTIGELVGKFSDARNSVISDWVSFGGRAAVIDGLTKAFTLLKDILKPISEAFRSVFSPITGKHLANLSKSFGSFMKGLRLSPAAAKELKTIFEGLFSAISLGWSVLKTAFKGLTDVIKPLLPLGGNLKDLALKVAQFFIDLKGSTDASKEFVKAGKTIADGVTKFYGKVQEIFLSYSDEIERMGEISVTVVEQLKIFYERAKEYFTSFGDELDRVVVVLKTAQEKLKEFYTKAAKYIASFEDELQTLVRTLKEAQTKLKEFYTKTKTYLESFSDEILLVKDILKKAGDAIKDFYDKLTASSKSIDGSGIKKTLETIVGAFILFFNALIEFNPLEKIKTIFGGIKAFFEPVIKFFKDMAASVKEALGDVWRTDGIAGFMDVFNALLTGGILLAIKKFSGSITNLVGDFSKLTKNASGFVGGLKEILGGVQGTLQAYQDNLKGKTLLTIAMAIGILAASLLVLASIDPEKLTKASIAMGVLFVELTASLSALGGLMKGVNLGLIAPQLVAFAAAIFILTTALRNIASIPEKDLATAMASLTTLLVELIGVAKLLGGTPGFAAAALALIEMGVAVRLMVFSVEALGKLDPKVLSQGLIAVAEISAGMAAFAGIVSRVASGGTLVAAGAAMAVIAVALLELVGSVVLLGKVNPDNLTQGLTGLGVMLAEIGAFSVLISNTINPVNLIASAAAMVAMGLALVEIVGVVAVLGALNQTKMTQGLIGLGAAVGILVAAMLLTANPAVLLGAAAMVVMAGAVRLFTPAIVSLGKLDLEQIGKALLALIGVFVVLGAAGLLLGPVIPVLLGLAAAIALLGVGIFAIGAGIALFGAGLTALSAGGTAAISLLIFAINEVILLLPRLMEKLGEGIIRVAGVVAAGAPVIADAIISILSSMSELLIGEIPKFIYVAMTFVDNLLWELVKKVPSFIDAGMKIILGFLEGVTKNIQPIIEESFLMITRILDGITNRLPELTRAGAEFIAAFLKGIGEQSPVVIGAAFTLIIDFINGLADSIRENTPLLMAAIGNLATAFIDGFLAFFGITGGSSEEGRGFASAILQGIIDGITAGAQAVVLAFINAGKMLIDGFKELFGINSPSTVMYGFGDNIMTGLLQAIEALAPGLVSATRAFVYDMLTAISEKLIEFNALGDDLMNTFMDGVRAKTHDLVETIRGIVGSMTDAVDVGAFIDVGKNIAEGIVDGVESKVNDVVSSVRSMGDAALAGIRDLLGIQSPSKAFSEIGRFSALGMAAGVEKYAAAVIGATKVMGQESLTAATSAMDALRNGLADNLETSPTITPVLDLSTLKSGASEIGQLLRNDTGYRLARDVANRSIRAETESIQNGSKSKDAEGVTINNNFDLTGLTVREEADIDRIAKKLAQKQQVAARGKGLRTLPNTTM